MSDSEKVTLKTLEDDCRKLAEKARQRLKEHFDDAFAPVTLCSNSNTICADPVNHELIRRLAKGDHLKKFMVDTPARD